ncbi:MAG: 3-phosphoglycerate dehydrogenase [Candidatus Cloacimonetes bacterium]|nr:3-phosphoglycerate dehydrogenase [Candidatus Cloacimonadota bacterium]MCF7814685.1 3-phosphoglycerate dehydrogenase [Candidatus Cloacimonadota bacterium]MCF7868247.1 3-phosphoglycerate dehydrogenase [Candidatus Cloacimonadota bacterium]MCF7883680.1 3-phosphoglycerate dehydrogenase [Candidatus Cloacimonadota bacterium]
MPKKVLVATQKPFAAAAVVEIEKICKEKGYEFILNEKYPEQADLVKAVKDVDALIVRSDKVTKEVIDNADNLKVVVRAGAGYDNLDCEAASDKKIVCMNTPGQNSNAVAELAFGMMVYMARGQFNGKPGTELKGKTLGIHAYGNVGVNVARIAKGFDMKILAFDPYVDAEKMKKEGVEPVETVEELYNQSDYVSLHLPSIPATQKFVNKNLISIMKQGATIINTARKEVVCEDGLLFVLSERKDLKYASDIAPVNKDEMLEKLPNQVFFTPKKMGAQTLEANVNAGVAAINQIINYFENGDTTFQVNK